jgi:hypothetical protein
MLPRGGSSGLLDVTVKLLKDHEHGRCTGSDSPKLTFRDEAASRCPRARPGAGCGGRRECRAAAPRYRAHGRRLAIGLASPVVTEISPHLRAAPPLSAHAHTMLTYLTIYCGRRHRTSDGVPVEHPCRLLDPEYLKAEHAKDYERAAEILERMPLILHGGLSSVDGTANQRVSSQETCESLASGCSPDVSDMGHKESAVMK